jgi:hypothetical protein
VEGKEEEKVAGKVAAPKNDPHQNWRFSHGIVNVTNISPMAPNSLEENPLGCQMLGSRLSPYKKPNLD